MRYKMQFTVCNDDVKQDRKLPTISFFDTDGNPIDLGAGVGGGSVDLTHLTELGFGSESDVTLERDFASLGSGNLKANTGLILDDPNGNGLYVLDSSDGNFWNAYAEFYDGGVSVYNSISHTRVDLSSAMLGIDTPDSWEEPIIGSYGPDYAQWSVTSDGRMSWWSETSSVGAPFNPDSNGVAFPQFRIEPDGALQWGSGTAAPDTHLARTGVGDMVFGDPTLTGPGIEFDARTTNGDGRAGVYLQTDGTSDKWIYLDAEEGITVGKHGGGIRLYNDDGSLSKLIRLNHAGTALELV